ncbi:hypothetical protein L1987_05886 [Smallanthus sonchifolius]|uniref:Uncharacterized protein n=1 Tax=Smallanthus sonchifolius TaxID=185202 RepID=A0ACB9JWJ5_9ASTR|nr:hypothetical protein L1987_05886 [Smallanthus sonchifolius]
MAMECNKDEAIRAKEIAENKMLNNDFEGGRRFTLKAQTLFPELDNISQMLAVCDVHCAAKRKINGAEMDLYGILQVERLADVDTIRKQYRKLALVLHPDKNRFHGAETAFKIISEANMILSDKVKRYLHDMKCKDPAKPSVPKPQNPPTNQSSQFGAQSKYFNGHVSNVRPLFWTFCPFCKMKYEDNKDLVNKRVNCPKCSRPFTAIDIGAYQSAPVTNMGRPSDPVTNTGRPTQPTSFQQKEVGKQETAKVDAQESEARQHTRTGDAKVGGGSRGKMVKNGNVKTKVGGPSVVSYSNGTNVKKSCKRSDLSYGEDAVEDCSPKKRSRRRKSASDVDKQEDKLKEEDVKSSSDSEDELEPVFVDVPDLEFSNFDRDKEEHCFAAGQIWAVYDIIDSMPRFYAWIRKVYSNGFGLRITWLEADPESHLERNWVQEGLPVACGKFKRGDSEETRDRFMFSHQMAFEKGSKRFSFVIYPKKGEIWALFKDWDIKWSSDPETHMKFKFVIVEILSDFDKDDGFLVSHMVKVEGFVSLFQKTSCALLAEHRVPPGDLFRFSHRIPSLKLTGNERADVPAGSCELDTASLPDDLNEYYFSNIATSSEGKNPSCQDDDDQDDDDDKNISSKSFTKSSDLSSPSEDDKEPKIIIHDFSLDKQNRKFQKGEIWALCKSANGHLGRYAQIKKIEPTPLRLHVDLLELCTDAIRPNACGIYKACTSGSQIFQQDSFLYLVKAEVNGKNRFNIYPREKEIWVLCNTHDAKCTFADVDVGGCDIVEVVENNGDVIKVLFLTRVGGYKSVFRALERVVEIPLAESDRFFSQVPAFLVTNEQDGRLRGFWELDLAEFPGLLPT